MKSSPTNALQVEALDPPLAIRRQFLADRYIYKMSQNSDHCLRPKLQKLSGLITSNNYWFNKQTPCLVKGLKRLCSIPYKISQSTVLPIFSTPFDALIYKPNIILDFGISKNFPAAEALFASIVGSQWSDWHHFFTDASKRETPAGVGAAVWFPKYSTLLSFKCPPMTSFSQERQWPFWRP
jgi:hypothetical protein